MFGVSVLGCSSTPKTSESYYNLGDVSETNCALIQVTPISLIYDANTARLISTDYLFSKVVKIDGQGDEKQWQQPPKGVLELFEKDVIVRVTPGVHTFTITFIYDSYELPCDITYDCKVGKGYSFDALAKEQYTLNGQGLGFVNTSVIINEYDVNEKGKFGGFSGGFVTSSRKNESFDFSMSQDPKTGKITEGRDRGRLVKRQK